VWSWEEGCPTCDPYYISPSVTPGIVATLLQWSDTIDAGAWDAPCPLVANPRTTLGGPGLRDVSVGWDPPVDVTAIANYAVYVGTTYDVDGAGYVFLGAVPVGQNALQHLNAGKGDPGTYYYRILTNTSLGTFANPQQVAKVGYTLAAGSNALSIPVLPFDGTVAGVMASIAGEFTAVRAYDASDVADPWKAYYPGRGGDLTDIAVGAGFWVEVAAGGVSLAVTGYVPASTGISLEAGWNFLSLPTALPRSVASALGSLPYTRVESAGSAGDPYGLRTLGPSDLLRPREGFWVYLTAAATWTVPFVGFT
jgi:hypothetical protein